MKKFVITALVLLFVGAGALGWWYMFHRLDDLLEAEFQNAASDAFGTPVTVGDIRLNLVGGSMHIDDLAIGNPPGYSRENAVVFGSIEAAVDFRTGDVDRVILDRAEIHIQEKDGETNVQRLKAALESRISRETGGSVDSDDLLVVRRFLMRSTSATFESDTSQGLTEVEIDEIEMRDLSGTADEVAEQIAMAVMQEITRKAESASARDRS